ncbi:MAG: phenylalanine--tRNA ligase subunit alpha [Fibrobacterales bacterium]|nr:phenylalanine--tRNA ligase subunit alpha [Fibrobacterales bacterium]
MDLKPIETLREQFKAKLAELDTSNLQAVADFRTRFLGKKGEIVALLKQMGSLLPEERPKFGQHVNELKSMAEAAIEAALAKARETRMNRELESGWIDVTEPGRALRAGSLHPLNEVREQVVDFFRGLGFEVAGGREIETDWYNFEALNIPPDHPARDMQDTFYVADGVVLRTQTSGVQIHVMENQKPPIRMIAPGHVYRCDADATHAPMFQQVEGLVVDEGISFADLKGILFLWARELFGEGTRIRFRPSFFPFTEPSAEMDVSCFDCGGKGCRTCKGTGWIEIGGCGSVDPAVFERVGVDPERYTGFAFGFGIDRIAMVKRKISEIGLLTANDNRFARQF